MFTAYHAKYYAHELTRRHTTEGVGRLSQSLFDASVDLNPHQIEAAPFALRNPLREGGEWSTNFGHIFKLFFRYRRSQPVVMGMWSFLVVVIHQIATNIRLGHPLGQWSLQQGLNVATPVAGLELDYRQHKSRISVVEQLQGHRLVNPGTPANERGRNPGRAAVQRLDRFGAAAGSGYL